LSRGIRALALAPLAFVIVACAPQHHTIEPYRSDPIAARALEVHAHERCAAGPDGPRSLPEELFVTDGCSLWLDGDWVDPCCVEHDVVYWCGGSASERSAADAALRQCVDERASGFVAWLMWVGVRAGGHPLFPTGYRWGYGRDYSPWYGDYPARVEPSADRAPRSP
jgi:hypothetical protein